MVFEWCLDSGQKQFLCESGTKREVEKRGWELRLGVEGPDSTRSHVHVNRLNFSLWLRAGRRLQGQAVTRVHEAGQGEKRGRGQSPQLPMVTVTLGSGQLIPCEAADPVLPARQIFQEKPNI